MGKRCTIYCRSGIGKRSSKTRGKKNTSLAAQRELAEIEIRDPAHFVSGQLHDSAIHWNSILENSKSDQSTLVSNWLKNGVDILPFSAGSNEILKDNHLIQINPQNSIFKIRVTVKMLSLS